MMAREIPDLIQRREHRSQRKSTESNASSKYPAQNSPVCFEKLRNGQPPSYESFLRKKSQQTEKPQKHIHFADDAAKDDLKYSKICDSKNNMVDYYNARDKSRVERYDSYSPELSPRIVGKPVGVHHSRQVSEPTKNYNVKNTVTSVMV